MKNSTCKPVPRKAVRTVLASAAFLLAGTIMPGIGQAEDLSDWKLPPVPVPADNPQTEAKIELGHKLTFDTRLSKNNSMSCAGCHLSFAGGGGHTRRAFGHGGELGRWAPSYFNSAYYTITIKAAIRRMPIRTI